MPNRVAACATHARGPAGYCVHGPIERPTLLRRVRACERRQDYCQGRFVVTPRKMPFEAAKWIKRTAVFRDVNRVTFIAPVHE